MKTVRTALLLCSLLCGLPLRAQTVKVNWQTGAPFSTYKTFAWQDPKSQTIPFYGPWVKADVIAELQTKGLTPVSAGQKPDLIVTYHMQGQELLDATSTTDGFGMGAGPWGGGWGWYGGWGGWGPWSDDSTTFTSEHPRTILILTIDRPMPHRTRRSFFAARRPSKTSPNPNRETKSRLSNVLRKYSRAIPPNQGSSALTFASEDKQ